MPPLIRATTSIRVVTGRRMAKTVGFMNHRPRRLVPDRSRRPCCEGRLKKPVVSRTIVELQSLARSENLDASGIPDPTDQSSIEPCASGPVQQKSDRLVGSATRLALHS